MPCYYPKQAWLAPGGGITFCRSGGYTDKPYTVACRQCSGCRLESSRQWATRIMHEAQMHTANSFITLTYADKHFPPGGSLYVEHWQQFAKRLRKKHKFRFFHAGEYGDKYGRPHYHAAMFGLDFRADRKVDKKTDEGFTLYRSEYLETTWGKGKCWIGDLTFDSAAYVARYLMKKQTGENAEEQYGVIVDTETGETFHQINPEYTTMSRRPGIGQSWIHKFHADVYPRDEVITNGKQCRPPAYYDRELEKFEPQVLKKIKVDRQKNAIQYAHNNTWDRLRVREECQAARMNHYARKLEQ